MDKEARSAIERATQKARRLLEVEFAEQLAGDFDIMHDGRIGDEASSHLDQKQRAVRTAVLAAISHKRVSGMQPAQSVADYLRDAAFTTLNRFVALKMLERRDLVQECISRGDASSGFTEFTSFAPGLRLPDGSGYRHYIESLFDEMSTEIKVLFDRRDPSGGVWPRKPAFDELLELLNSPDLGVAWDQDETLGWVYQYFNSGDERRAMREASQAPRNSKELAIRNQFFTQRYVVQFLGDNTLGRIWYEMRSTDTAFATSCRYMVRTPEEKFPLRLKKDPRDLHTLDPACGSGHFLLYLFDLFLVIYEEAFFDHNGPKSMATGRALAEDYLTIDDLRKDIPRLILLHNLHGVDIDVRCAQIAQLSLWMRAQKVYRDFNIRPENRVKIRRSNIAVAEPLAADKKTLDEFLSSLIDPSMRSRFAALAQKLSLAGEMGLLIRLEALVETQANSTQAPDLFALAEQDIQAALFKFYRDDDPNSRGRKRLFVDDANHGIALFRVANKKYDVIVMNPPFGEATPASRSELKNSFGQSSNDLFSAFVARALELRSPGGVVGAITSRTGFFMSSLSEWRELVYSEGIYAMADLGDKVMDSAMVEAAAYCIGIKKGITVFRLLSDENKEQRLQGGIERIKEGELTPYVYQPSLAALKKIPNHPFAYWVPDAVIDALVGWPRFEEGNVHTIGAVRKGLRTGDNNRFVRAFWEVSSQDIVTNGTDSESTNGWVPLVMTGSSQPWFSPIFLVVNWKKAGREMRASVLKHGAESRLIQAREFYFRSGFSWTLRSTRLYPYGVPTGCIFTGSRPMAFPGNMLGAKAALGIFASRAVSSAIRWNAEKFAHPKFAEGHLKNVPIPKLEPAVKLALEDAVDIGVAKAREAYSRYEPFLEFTFPYLVLLESDKALAFDPAWLLAKETERLITQSYGLTFEEAETLSLDLDEALTLGGRKSEEPNEDIGLEEDLGADTVVLPDGPTERAWRLVSYAFGVLAGRWDIRLAMGLHSAPPQPPVDAPLSQVPRGALKGLEGNFLLNKDVEGYPAKIGRGDILVHDVRHIDDIALRVPNILALLNVDATILLGLLNKDWEWSEPQLWKSFFQVHTRIYTLGRRKAPIYWQIATSSGSYSIWIYVVKCNNDTMFRVQSEFLAPKIMHEEVRLQSLLSVIGDTGIAAQRRELRTQEIFVEELRSLSEEVRRVAPLWSPNLDDGAIINAAPLWRLFSHQKAWQKDLKATWKALEAGDYDWSQLAMRLWPERVVPKCASDRSLAIAHGLEHQFWAMDAGKKWKPLDCPSTLLSTLITERVSQDVKAALQSLLDAPDGSSTKRSPRTKAS